MEISCCFVDCIQPGSPTDGRVELWPPPDFDPVVLAAHRACFDAQRNPSVEPDPPDTRGVPSSARCVFCGQKLPIVGRHPYALSVAFAAQSERFWAHAQCVEQELVPFDLKPSGD